MKNAKKALALTLAGSMALSSFAVVSAQETETKDKLDKLMELNIVKGDSSDDDSLSFDKQMERYRSVVLMLRLTEAGAEAMEKYDFEGKDTFADQGEFSTYVERLMAYAHNTDIGIDGYEDGTFRPTDTLTVKAYAKMMLESLGYDYNEDFTWKQVAEKAAEVGIVDNASDVTDEVAPFGEIIDMTYDTLASNVKGEALTLGEKIGKPVVNSKLEVAKVEALNLKQVKVTFSTSVDKESAEKLANYDLDAKNASLTDAKVELVDDNAVVITLGTAAKQQDKVTLTVEDILAANGKVLEETDVEVAFLDQTIPTVKGIEVVGNKTLKVSFSEPMETVEEDNFEVKSGSKKLYLDEVEAVNKENTEFYVTLYNDLKEGEIAVSVSGAEDYAGFNVVKDTVSIDVEVDKEAPTVVGYKDATPNKVTLIFSEDIRLESLKKEDFYHTNYKNTVASIAKEDVEGNELTLTFDDDSKLPQGTAYVYVADKAVSDLWGNENDQIMTTIKVEIDETAPVVEEVEVKSEDQLVVTFDEALNEKTAEDKDNYRLVNSDGKEVKEISSLSYNGEKKTVTVNFKDSLSGDYTLFVEDVEDLSKNKIDTEIEFNVDDLTKPVFSKFTATLYNTSKEQIVKVAFGEAMAEEGNYSITDEDKYIVDGNQLSKIEDAYIDVVDGAKAIEIHIPTDSGVTIATGSDNLEIARVADAAGNKTDALSGTLDIQGKDTVKIESVEATTMNTLVLTFDDRLTNIEPTDFVIKASGTAVNPSSVDVDENEDGNTVITFTTSEDLAANAAGLTVEVSGTESHNRYDEVVDATVPAVEDKIAPEVVMVDDAEKVVISGNTVTISFTEALKTDNVSLIATELEVSKNGDALVGAVDYTTAVSGSDLVITFTGLATDDDIEIATKATVNYLVDMAGTATKAFDLSLEVK